MTFYDIVTQAIGISVVVVLLRMNHTLGQLVAGLKHVSDVIEDHEIRLRAVEAAEAMRTRILATVKEEQGEQREDVG